MLLAAGDSLSLPSGVYRAVSITLSSASQPDTRADEAVSLRIITSYDTVQIHRPKAEVFVLVGQLARVVSDLASVQQPLAWEELARPLWPHIDDRDALRRRWDGLLGRLRERLREGGIRPDLVASTRIGLVELVLREGDEIVDRA